MSRTKHLRNAKSQSSVLSSIKDQKATNYSQDNVHFKCKGQASCFQPNVKKKTNSLCFFEVFYFTLYGVHLTLRLKFTSIMVFVRFNLTNCFLSLKRF